MDAGLRFGSDVGVVFFGSWLLLFATFYQFLDFLTEL